MQVAKLIHYLKTMKKAGMPSVKFTTIVQDLKINEDLAKYWLAQLEKNGYVQIVWGNVKLKDKLLRREDVAKVA